MQVYAEFNGQKAILGQASGISLSITNQWKNGTKDAANMIWGIELDCNMNLGPLTLTDKVILNEMTHVPGYSGDWHVFMA